MSARTLRTSEAGRNGFWERGFGGLCLGLLGFIQRHPLSRLSHRLEELRVVRRVVLGHGCDEVLVDDGGAVWQDLPHDDVGLAVTREMRDLPPAAGGEAWLLPRPRINVEIVT